MCPACLATLAMMVAGAASTGGVATLLVNKFRVKAGAKKTIAVREVKELQLKEKAS
jgi:hypothetical protein